MADTGDDRSDDGAPPHDTDTDTDTDEHGAGGARVSPPGDSRSSASISAAAPRQALDGGTELVEGAAAGPAARPARGERRRKLTRRLAWGLGSPAAIVALFMVADFTYAHRVAGRYRAWNETISRDADGVREGCREFTLEARGERRPTAILMVHGFAASADLWRRMATVLAGKGYTCRAMRLPGFAMPLEEYRKTSLARWREAVAAEVAALGRSHGRVFIVSHSLGGALTLDYALDHPPPSPALPGGEAAAAPRQALDGGTELVEGAAAGPEAPVGIAVLAPLVEVSGERSPLLSPRAWYRVLDAVLTFTDVVETAGETKCADPDALAGIATERHVPRSVFRDIFGIIGRIEGRAGELRTPVFMALSPDDVTIDSDAARRYFEAAGSRTKRLILVEGSSHLLPVDRGFRGLAEEIARFIRELEDGGG